MVQIFETSKSMMGPEMFHNMSPQEFAFVRLYTLSLREDFDAFTTALNLMRPNTLNIKCPVQASELAVDILKMRKEFETALIKVADKDGMRKTSETDNYPTVEEMIQIMQMSFFKLSDPKLVPEKVKNKGWFSGHPFDWQKVYHKLQKLDAELSPLQSIFNAFAKLLGSLSPPPNIYGFSFKPEAAQPEEDDGWWLDDEDENNDDYNTFD